MKLQEKQDLAVKEEVNMSVQILYSLQKSVIWNKQLISLGQSFNV